MMPKWHGAICWPRNSAISSGEQQISLGMVDNLQSLSLQHVCNYRRRTKSIVRNRFLWFKSFSINGLRYFRLWWPALRMDLTQPRTSDRRE